MDKRFTAVRVLVVSVLAVYLLLGALSTGGVALPIGVLLLGLILWFSVYRFRHNGLGNRELVTKMHADLKGTLERIEERMAQEEARRRAAEEHEERARVEREKRRVEGERRKASITARDPAVSRYAETIENKVREGERTTRGSEGPYNHASVRIIPPSPTQGALTPPLSPMTFEQAVEYALETEEVSPTTHP